MALTGILFWFFGFFYCLYYYYFFGKYGLNTNNQANISRKRQFSNVFRSWMNKENHALLFGHRGGGGYREMQIMHSDLIRETQTELCRMHNLCEKKKYF